MDLGSLPNPGPRLPTLLTLGCRPSPPAPLCSWLSPPWSGRVPSGLAHTLAGSPVWGCLSNVAELHSQEGIFFHGALHGSPSAFSYVISFNAGRILGGGLWRSLIYSPRALICKE